MYVAPCAGASATKVLDVKTPETSSMADGGKMSAISVTSAMLVSFKLMQRDTPCIESLELPIVASPSASSDEIEAIDKMELSNSRSSMNVGGLMLSRLDWQLLRLELMSSNDVAFKLLVTPSARRTISGTTWPFLALKVCRHSILGIVAFNVVLDDFSGLPVIEIRLSITDGGWIILNVEQTELEKKSYFERLHFKMAMGCLVSLLKSQIFKSLFKADIIIFRSM